MNMTVSRQVTVAQDITDVSKMESPTAMTQRIQVSEIDGPEALVECALREDFSFQSGVARVGEGVLLIITLDMMAVTKIRTSEEC